MKLSYSIAKCSEIMSAQLDAADVTQQSEKIVEQVAYDSRKINAPTNTLFFALSGAKNGHSFIQDAYRKGIRYFVVNEKQPVENYPEAVFLAVENVLVALQQLAQFHRQQFNYPVIAITGSLGKTTFKEWAFHVLSPRLRIVRSPKSFNSQLGVALSLLELHSEVDLAIIEAGISEPNEMEKLEWMIRPTLGVLTTFGNAHRSNFESATQHLAEKLKLFSGCSHTFYPNSVLLSETQQEAINGISAHPVSLNKPWITTGYESMLGVLKQFCFHLGCSENEWKTQLETLPQLALRMETFEGINNTTIINDTYNLEVDALTEALHYQKKLAGNRNRIVVIGLSESTLHKKEELEEITKAFAIHQLFFIESGESIPWQTINNAVVLVKGSRDIGFEKQVSKGKLLRHKTTVEINLSAIRHNLSVFRKRLKPETNLLCMVKASSYGSGAERVAGFLQQEGVNYFGVAFADEGVALREAGITVPIMVMNTDADQAQLMVDYQLEPTLFSVEQLDAFVTALVHQQQTHYPVHLKFDTGMHRLGFSPSEKEKVLAMVNSQPEINVVSIYSHLADADNNHSTDFTLQQISQFESIISYFKTHLSTPFKAHILNSEGALRFPTAQFDRVRLGIALYGYPNQQELRNELLPSIQWKSAISQLKHISKGESVGYSCAYTAENDMQIAIIPVGYADGFRRSLSNGKGSVFIHGKHCAVVGNVCMDMIMVDVTGLIVSENDSVEIIGENQSMLEIATQMNTIPYEVMTGLSKRMHRIYVED